MTNQNYSLSKTRDLVNRLRDTMNFLTSGCVEDQSSLRIELEELISRQLCEVESELNRIVLEGNSPN